MCKEGDCVLNKGGKQTLKFASKRTVIIFTCNKNEQGNVLNDKQKCMGWRERERERERGRGGRERENENSPKLEIGHPWFKLCSLLTHIYM